MCPAYDRFPGRALPAAIEQSCAAAKRVSTQGQAHLLDASRVAVAGDSVGIIHDFVMLNALHHTHAAKAAIRQATGFPHSAFHHQADHLHRPAST